MRRLVRVSAFTLLFLLPAAYAAESIATTDGEMPGLRLEVQELKAVSGGAVMLRYTVINDSDQVFGLNDALKEQGSIDWHGTDGVYLVDLAGKKKYPVVRDAEKHCLCSRNVPDLAAKSSANFWAKFPAPPEGVQKIGVVVPHFIPLDDVPLAR
jgi:hypothetical protein